MGKKNGRPKLAPQDIVRAEIRRYLDGSDMSLRNLAMRIGLTGPASLSRFLSGKQRISLDTILSICKELGIEGRAYDRIIESQIPKEFLPVTRERTSTRGKEETLSRRERKRKIEFFFHEDMPLVYEALKIVKQTDTISLYNLINAKIGCSKLSVEQCLQTLEEMDLVIQEDGVWRVIDPSNDIVIPSKASNEIGKRIIRKALNISENMVNQPSNVRMMRSILTTVKVDDSESSIDVVKPLILSFQDDVLEVQGSRDNAVLQIFVSAMEVARKI